MKTGKFDELYIGVLSKKMRLDIMTSEITDKLKYYTSKIKGNK